ncbi:GTP 3',8-cyclase MoaA [Salinisphaera sp. LB1]|uniref:GTP 3',8-cyclase MoaA n=1 Tax=Salinisphaera sp. LB1 TaxID=2183911 RepID=UPI000D705193|nr:GTP 3',8-cyclase MoaA [Salinisphaera sp. LB1]
MPILTDTFNRPLRDLRISLTDRCNFRCTYCMPRELFGAEHFFLPGNELLDFDEIERVSRIAAGLGVTKLRLTGGEPLLRRNIDVLISRLATVNGIDDICLTTNGSLLTAKRARELKAAGLNRVTLSLDAIDDRRFKAINDVGFPTSKVLEAIDNATGGGLSPVKVNCVIQRGVNDDQILPMAEAFRHTEVVLRFIEYMDVGATNGWRLDDVVSAREIMDTIRTRHAITRQPATQPGETANRWRYDDGAGEIGIIASVSMPFCGGCTRARLSAIGELYTCLFGLRGHDLRTSLRSGATDADLATLLGSIWNIRDDRYSERRSEETTHRHAGFNSRVEMSYIGG